MTGWIVLGCIVLFFALFLSQRIKVFVKMGDVLTLRAGLGLIVLKLAPKKPRKPVDPDSFSYKKHQKRLKKDRAKAAKKAEKKKAKAEKKRQAKLAAKEAKKTEEPKEKKSLEETLDFVFSLLDFAGTEIPRLVKTFHIDIRSLRITVGGAEPDQVAKQYGILCASVPLLLDFLDNKTTMKPLREGTTVVEADFLLPKTKIEADFSFQVTLFTFVRTGFRAAFWFIRQKLGQIRLHK